MLQLGWALSPFTFYTFFMSISFNCIQVSLTEIGITLTAIKFPLTVIEFYLTVIKFSSTVIEFPLYDCYWISSIWLLLNFL